MSGLGHKRSFVAYRNLLAGRLCWTLYGECDALASSRARICLAMVRRASVPLRALRYSSLLRLRAISRLSASMVSLQALRCAFPIQRPDVSRVNDVLTNWNDRSFTITAVSI